jgi:hypothetical protein
MYKFKVFLQKKGISTPHRVYRVLSFFSSRLNWDSLTLSLAGECVAPSFGSEGEVHTRLQEGLGVPIPNTLGSGI